MEKSSAWMWFPRSVQWRLRILVFGFDTILAPAPTTCTRSTVVWQERMQLRLCIKTWPQDIDQDFDQYIFLRSSNLRRQMMWNDHIWSSYWRKISNFLYLIEFPRLPAKNCLSESDLQHFSNSNGLWIHLLRKKNQHSCLTEWDFWHWKLDYSTQTFQLYNFRLLWS